AARRAHRRFPRRIRGIPAAAPGRLKPRRRRFCTVRRSRPPGGRRPMKTNRRTRPAALGLLLASPLLLAQQAAETAFQQGVRAAMQGEIRTPQERARDVNRLPVEILGFFRMREDMRVIEILPAGGWFTKLLGPALRDKGKLYVTHPEG